jgi:hypothetical protein
LKNLLPVLAVALAAAGCAGGGSGGSAVSTIPWDERAQMDGLHQDYGMFEDDAVYDGMLTPEPLSYEEF